MNLNVQVRKIQITTGKIAERDHLKESASATTETYKTISRSEVIFVYVDESFVREIQCRHSKNSAK